MTFQNKQGEMQSRWKKNRKVCVCTCEGEMHMIHLCLQSIPFQCCSCKGKSCKTRIGGQQWTQVKKKTKKTQVILSLDQLKKKKKLSYLFPTSSPVTVCPSTIVNAPIPDKEINQFIQRRFHQKPAASSQHRNTYVYLEVPGSSVSLFQLLWRW